MPSGREKSDKVRDVRERRNVKEGGKVEKRN